MYKNLLIKSIAFCLTIFLGVSLFAQGESCATATDPVVGENDFSMDIPSNGNNVGNPDATGALWYKFSPTEDGVITISTCLNLVDTEIYLYDGTCDELNLLAYGGDNCELFEGEELYASEISSIIVFAGTTYYIEFDNRWDASAATFSLTFDQLPNFSMEAFMFSPPLNIASDQKTNIRFHAVAQNIGIETLTNVVFVTEIASADDPETILASVSSAPGSLENLNDTQFFTNTLTPPSDGEYIITSMFTLTEESENTIEPEIFNISVGGLESYYTKTISNGFGNGNGTTDPFEFGNIIDINVADEVYGMNVTYSSYDPESAYVQVSIRNVEDGIPTDIIYTEDLPASGGQNMNFYFDTPLTLEPGTYFFGMEGAIDNTNEAFGISDEYAYPGISLFRIDSQWLDISDNAFFSSNTSVLFGVLPVDVTFEVDMSQQDMVSADGVHIAGTFNEWTPEVMTDNGNGVWSFTISVDSNSEIEYKFLNGNSFDFEEAVPEECGVDNGFGGFNRAIAIEANNVEVSLVCFGECSFCIISAFDDCEYETTFFDDDIDSYTLDAVSDQADHWFPWNANSGSALVSDEHANSGTNSVHILEGGDLDQLVGLVAPLSEGQVSVDFYLYILEDFGAYFNIQADAQNPGDEFKMQVTMDPEGAGDFNVGGENIPFTFPKEQWFPVEICIDLDNDYASINVDGVGVAEWEYNTLLAGAAVGGTARFGGINFYPIDGDYSFFVDDVSITSSDNIAPFNLTVSVDMSGEEVSNEGVFIAGSFNDWSDTEMIDNGNGVYIITLEVQPFMEHQYKFKNGPDGWETNINAGDCVTGDDNNRFVFVDNHTNIPTVCFNTCATEQCGVSNNDIALGSDVRISPNPTNNTFILSYEFDQALDLEVSIINNLGEMVQARNLDKVISGNIEFDIIDLPHGVYHVLITNDNRFTSKKLIVQ